MRFRKVALALCACLALGVLPASAAQAAEGEGWTIGGLGVIPNGTHQGVSCEKHFGAFSTLIFTSTLLGSEVELSAEGVDCLEKAGSTNPATIDNTTTRGHSEGVLTFTGVKVVKPANCSVAGGEITTALVTDQVIMDTKVAGSTSVLDRFSAEEGVWDSVELQGALCPLAENTAALKGTLCGEFTHTNAAGTGFEPTKTGTLTKVQTLLFGEAQQKTAGCALTTGGAAATVTGAVDFELGSTKPFGAD
jgi:hypothetical protein